MKSWLLFLVVGLAGRSHAQIFKGKEQVSRCSGSVHLRQNSIMFRVISDPVKRTSFNKYEKVEVNVEGSCCYKVFHRPKFRGEHVRLESAGTFSFFGKHVQSVARVKCRGVVRAGAGQGGVVIAGFLLVLAMAGIFIRWRRGGWKKVEQVEQVEQEDVEMIALNKHQEDVWTMD